MEVEKWGKWREKVREENEEKDGEKEEGWRIGEVSGKWRENVTGKSGGWRGQVEEWRMGQRANIREVDS